MIQETPSVHNRQVMFHVNVQRTALALELILTIFERQMIVKFVLPVQSQF